MSIFHIRTSPQLSGNGDKYQGASRLAFFFGIICLKGANMYLFYIFPLMEKGDGIPSKSSRLQRNHEPKMMRLRCDFWGKYAPEFFRFGS